LTTVRKQYKIQAMEYIEERALNLYVAQNPDMKLFGAHNALKALRGTFLFERLKMAIAIDDLKIALRQALFEIKRDVKNIWKGQS